MQIFAAVPHLRPYSDQFESDFHVPQQIPLYLFSYLFLYIVNRVQIFKSWKRPETDLKVKHVRKVRTPVMFGQALTYASP